MMSRIKYAIRTCGKPAAMALFLCLVIGAGDSDSWARSEKRRDSLPLSVQNKEKFQVRAPGPVIVQTPAVTFTGIDWAPPQFPPFTQVTVTTPAVTFTGIETPVQKILVPLRETQLQKIGGKRNE